MVESPRVPQGQSGKGEGVAFDLRSAIRAGNFSIGEPKQMNDCIQVATLCVQILALAGLVWYVIETRSIRQASQHQVRISQDLSKAAADQVEGTSKPCLTLWGTLRDGNDAILNMNGAVGNIAAGFDEGSYVTQNIGNGVAMNVRYHFTRPDENPDRAREAHYIPYVLASQKVALIESRAGYAAEHNVTFDYESLGGRKYRTTIHLNHHVLTAFVVEEVRNPAG